MINFSILKETLSCIEVTTFIGILNFVKNYGLTLKCFIYLLIQKHLKKCPWLQVFGAQITTVNILKNQK